MPDLTMAGFVLARLAEDAEEAADATAGPWFAEDRNEAWGDDNDTLLIGRGKILAALRSEYRGYFNGLHIARWDPARVLAEVEAKRQLIDLIFRHAATVDGEWGCCHDADQIRAGRCPDTPVDDVEGLRLLALPYSGHEGYRAGWAPGE